MGKKGSWFSAVKKVLISPEQSEKKDKKKSKSKRWFGGQRSQDLDATPAENATVPTLQEMKLSEAEDEQNKHAYSVAVATAMAAEAAVAAAKAAAEVARLTAAARYAGKSKEEIAAIKIQNAYRGHRARRALRAIRGLVRLKTMVQGQSVKRQAATTLRCMQTLTRVQSQVRARRIRMTEENEALQRQLQKKREKELEKSGAAAGDNWNDSTRSKEQQQVRLQIRQEAAIRRERALAYSYSHQQTWRNSSKSESQQTFMDPNNPHWGWSWLERWMAARPWESNTAVEKELNGDHPSAKCTANEAASAGDLRANHEDTKPSPSAKGRIRPPSYRRSPSTPHSRAAATPSQPAGKPRSPRSADEDSRSVHSTQSEFQRRHSTASSSARDDESLASSPAVPSYTNATRSAKPRPRSRLQSPQALGKSGTTTEKGSVCSTKKRLSFSASTPAAGGARRHSAAS